MSRHNLEQEEPTSCDECVELARYSFKITAENLGMQKNYNTMLSGVAAEVAFAIKWRSHLQTKPQ